MPVSRNLAARVDTVRRRALWVTRLVSPALGPPSLRWIEAELGSGPGSDQPGSATTA
ncbi:MAG: hypothetical protein WBH47_07910 [Streptosporangiaceae bacterium]